MISLSISVTILPDGSVSLSPDDWYSTDLSISSERYNAHIALVERGRGWADVFDLGLRDIKASDFKAAGSEFLAMITKSKLPQVRKDDVKTQFNQWFYANGEILDGGAGERAIIHIEFSDQTFVDLEDSVCDTVARIVSDPNRVSPWQGSFVGGTS